MNGCAALAERASVHGFATLDSTLPIAAAITPAAALIKEWSGSMPEGAITSAPLSRQALSSDLPLALNLSVVVLRDSGGNSSGSADDRWRLVRITLDRLAEASFTMLVLFSCFVYIKDFNKNVTEVSQDRHAQ
jgi:hypothetical protein